MFVKANNAEISESVRFQRFARADLDERFKKKKMKSLIPQIVQVMYLGSLSIFCVGAVILAGSSLSSSAIVSFVASLAFLIDPVQVDTCVSVAFHALPLYFFVYRGAVLLGF